MIPAYQVHCSRNQRAARSGTTQQLIQHAYPQSITRRCAVCSTTGVMTKKPKASRGIRLAGAFADMHVHSRQAPWSSER
jgi:hypothetical protein